MNEMSVREWQKRFRAGDFSSRDRAVQCEAGWYDWFCRDDALAGRLKKISGVVLGITDPFILDNYYVWFKNNCPLDGPLYDDVRFEPLTGERDGKYFVVSLDSPHEHMKWALVTERYGYDAPEFECGNVRDMVKYINAIAPELAQVLCFSTIGEAVSALRKGYVDMVVAHESVIQSVVHGSPEKYRMLDQALFANELGVAFEKGTHEALAARLQAVIDDMRGDGSAEAIVASYGLDAKKMLEGN